MGWGFPVSETREPIPEAWAVDEASREALRAAVGLWYNRLCGRLLEHAFDGPPWRLLRIPGET